MKREASYEKTIRNPVTNCRTLRKAKGISQTDLSRRAGVSLGVVCRLEHATTHRTLCHTWVGSFTRIARSLGVAPVELYPHLSTKL